MTATTVTKEYYGFINFARPATHAALFLTKDVYSRRWWRRSKHIANELWKRWILQYVPALQPRSKWTREQPSMKKDDIVLVADENSPRCDWPIGRIMELNRSAKMATFDQLVFVFAEKNLLVTFLDFVFSNNTTDVFCLICVYSFFIFLFVKCSS